MEVKILIADDEFRYRQLVTDFLENQGYKVIAAKDGAEAIDLFFSNQDIDLVVLDIMMPIYDGWEVCREIRKKSNVPILMLTALDEESKEVYGLEIGADDYVTKPFSYEVFMARVNALIRRTRAKEVETIRYKDLVINKSSHEVLVDNNVIELSPKEYNLLVYLVENYGKALNRDLILDAVWGYDFYGDRRTVDTHIKSIRSKLGKYGEFIHTIRSVGYKFEVKE